MCPVILCIQYLDSTGGRETRKRRRLPNRDPSRPREPMSDPVWISDRQETITELVERRLADDPDSEYLDVCGTKLTAMAVRQHLYEMQREASRSGRR